MKKIFIALNLLILTACGEHNVGVVDNKRMLVSGNILNAENAPLENISVIASGSEHDILGASEKQILGEAFTNISGEFSFVSLDTGNSFYGVSINHPNHETYREEFTTIHFLDSIGSRENSFELININLAKAMDFQLKVNNTSGSGDTLFYRIAFPSPEEYRELTENSFSGDLSGYQSEIAHSRRIFPEEDNRDYLYKTLENSSVQFMYKLSRAAVYDTINLEITPENPVYEFNY